jgi:hypothetical protein
MNVNHSVDLLIYGLMVAGLNLVAYQIAPGFADVMMKLLVAGGLVIVFLAVLGLRGYRRRSWPIVTLIVVAALLVVQAARAWLAVKLGVDGTKPVAAILSLLLFFAIMEVVQIAKAEPQLQAQGGKSAESAANDHDVSDEER